MKGHWAVFLVALGVIACSGGQTERGRRQAGAVPETRPSNTSASSPASPPAPSAGPDLSYAVVDPKMEGELPIRWVPVFNGPPRTRLEGGVLWAPAAPVIGVLAAGAKATVAGGRLQIDGQPTAVPALLDQGEPWAAVVPLARHFRAYGRVHEEDGSVAIWPREALLWLRDHGDPNAPVLREAKAAGLLDPGR